MEELSYVQYLQAKETVDDRALNVEVSEALKILVQRDLGKHVVHALEIGAGIGSTFLRALKKIDLFNGHKRVNYTLVDIKGEVLDEAYRRISALKSGSLVTMLEAKDLPVQCPSRFVSVSAENSIHHRGYDTHNGSTRTRAYETLELAGNPKVIVHFVLEDVRSFLSREIQKYDLVIAAAFLDLFNLDEIIPQIFSALNPASKIRAFYFPICFDGVTEFFPKDDGPRQIERKILSHFHHSMGYGYSAGKQMPRAETGRHLSFAIEGADGIVTKAGESPWKVAPLRNDKDYEGLEDFFLECILKFIRSSGGGEDCKEFSNEQLEEYIKYRADQVKSRSLVYIARNIDICGRILDITH